MKKLNLIKTVMVVVLICFSLNSAKDVRAESGDMGYFGGISEGTKLKKSLDKKTTTKQSKPQDKSFNYKEPIFLTGDVVVFEGALTIKQSAEVDYTKESGSYTITYTIKPDKDAEVKLERDLTLDVKYRIVDNQVLKDYTVNKWKESITIDGEKYTLNASKSNFNLPVIEYTTPGVKYYKASMSNRRVYEVSKEKIVTVEQTGQVYGYDENWSTTETQEITVNITEEGTNPSAMIIKLNPSLSANKVLVYDSNDPYVIGFAGNYIEVIRNNGGIKYEILSSSKDRDLIGKTETITVPTYNTMEQLIAPSGMDIWEGSFAEEDIRKLYSMEILEGNPKYYVPNEVLTRSQFVRILVRALGYTPYDDKKEVVIFKDVDSTHPNYGYIITAYNKGIIQGTGYGSFNPDAPITRQEAFVIYIRSLGLERLGGSITPVTPFLDDNKIDLWAKRGIMALYNIGLVKGDNGNIKPKDLITKAEGAAIINRMVDYLRTGIEKDYTVNLINY